MGGCAFGVVWTAWRFDSRVGLSVCLSGGISVTCMMVCVYDLSEANGVSAANEASISRGRGVQ